MSLVPYTLMNFQGSPVGSSVAGSGILMPSSAAAPYEGLWIPTMWFAGASVELFGVISSFSLDLYGTNADACPPNTSTITIGGSVTTGDTISIAVQNPALQSGRTIAVTAVNGDTDATLAATLAQRITADSQLQGVGLSAVAVGAVINLSWPSALSWGNYPQPANPMAFSITLSGGASETATLANGTDGEKIGNSIIALGIIATPTYARFTKARLTAFSGTAISGVIAGHS